MSFMAIKNKLSIYLVKEGLEDKKDIFDKPNDLRELQKYADGSVAYYVPSNTHKPSWLKSFFLNSNNSELWQANSRVVLLKQLSIGNEKRIFALTFGYARFLFKENVLEEQFGLRVILNTIQQNQIRRIAKSSVGSNQKQSDEQMPKSSDISEFGFDINRDLMRNVSGKSDDEMFENSMLTGGDIFSLTVSRDITNVDELLEYSYVRYKEDTYKEKFAWIDNIKYVKDKAKIDILNRQLVNEIRSCNYDKIWMAVPEVVSWEDIKDFKISGIKETYDDIYIDIVVDSLRNELIDVAQLQCKRICAMSSNDDKRTVYEWNGYNCIVAEIELHGEAYCLSNGKWYRINNNFVESINNQYSSIDLLFEDFSEYEGGSEDDYNDLLNKSLKGSQLLHKYKISIGGGQGNNIEPCDLLWKNKMIHVKKNGGSSVLSHLFNQALVAGQAWFDNDFRTQLHEKLKEAGEQDYIEEPFKSSDYEIIIAIINKFDDERPKIPFFSKVAICYAAKNMKNAGYNVKLKNIKMRSLDD